MLFFLFSTENEKENDSRGSQATQAIIQRRRRPKRRSTGVCNVGAEVNKIISTITHMKIISLMHILIYRMQIMSDRILQSMVMR